MSCNLFEVELKSAPPFEAISYRWAQAERDDGEHIIVSDCTLRVASNIFELLGDLRSTLLPRLIWIDSICIDQLSENEKSYQVYLMGDIDSSASLVTIWLGSPSREMSWTTLNRVIRWLPKRIMEVDSFDRILKSVFATLAFRLIDQLRINTSFTRDNLKAYREEGKYRFTAWWLPLMHLLVHEWFERVWVAQEAVLASEARVMYGRMCCTWDDFYRALAIVESNVRLRIALEWTQSTDCGKNKMTLRSFHVGTVCCMQHWRIRRVVGKGLPQFKDVMSTAHLLRASDPCDKVFGVHGLAAKGEGSRFTQHNYSKNTNEVYLDAALRVIEEGGLFELLSHAGTGCIDVDALQCLRSWVPDWSLARHAEPLGCISGQPPYRAGGTPNVLDLPSFANGPLVLRGAELDLVAELAPPHAPWLDAKLARVFKASREMVMSSSQAVDRYRKSAEPTSIDDVFIRLLIGDRTETEWPAPDSVRGLYDRWLLTMRLYEKMYRLVEANRGNQPAEDDYIEGMMARRKYSELISRAWRGRRVAVTRNGYVCFIPRHAKPGDAVWLIDGAPTPYVLRSRETVDGGWEFVGDCYVHGVMNGSAVVAGGPRKMVKLV